MSNTPLSNLGHTQTYQLTDLLNFILILYLLQTSPAVSTTLSLHELLSEERSSNSSVVSSANISVSSGNSGLLERLMAGNSSSSNGSTTQLTSGTANLNPLAGQVRNHFQIFLDRDGTIECKCSFIYIIVSHLSYPRIPGLDILRYTLDSWIGLFEINKCIGL